MRTADSVEASSDGTVSLHTAPSDNAFLIYLCLALSQHHAEYRRGAGTSVESGVMECYYNWVHVACHVSHKTAFKLSC